MYMNNINLAKRLAVVTLIALMAFVSGCASRGGAEDTPTTPSLRSAGKSVGSLSVSLADTLADDVKVVATDYTLAPDLDSNIRKNMDVGSGTLSVDVSIVKVKLRNNATAIFAGLYAGPDIIAARVVVREGGAVVKEFTTSSHTTRGAGRGGRAAHILKDLGKRVANGI